MSERLALEGRERPPFLLGARGAALLIAAAVALTQGWMIGLEFQLDDWEQLHDAAHPGRPGILLGSDGGAGRGLRVHDAFVRFFRPTLWADLALEVAVFGARPAFLHATSLLWHLAACLLLRALLVRLLPVSRPELAALLAALVFAVHPGKWSAISWVAARGDLLMTVFFLAAALALARYRTGGRGRDLAATWGLLLLALGAKEGAVVTPVLLLLLDLSALRRLGAGTGWKRSLRVSLPLAALAPLYLLGRRLAFGAAADLYAGQPRIVSLGVLERMAADFVPVFHRHLGGWFYFHEQGLVGIPGAVFVWMQGMLALLLGILLVIWCIRRPLVRGVTCGVLAAGWIVAVMPALRFYREAAGYDVSRLFYLPGVFAATAAALPLTWRFGGGRVMRILARVWLIALLVVTVPAALRHLAVQLAAADVIETVRRELHAFAEATPEKGVAFAVLGLPSGDVDHAPLYGTYLGYAFTEVFDDRPLLVEGVEHEGVFLGSGRLQSFAGPVRVLRWNGEGGDGRLESISPTLPAPTGHRPRIALEDGATSAALSPFVAPRDVAVIGVVFDRVPEAPFSLTLVFEDLAGGAVRLPLVWEPQRFGAAATALLPVARDRNWLFAAGLHRLRIETEGAAPRVVAIDLDARLPELELIAPDGDRVAAAGPEPVFTFRDPHGFPWLRIGVFAGGATRAWTLRREELEARDDGVLAFRMSQPGFIRAPDALREDPFYWDMITRPDGSDGLTHGGMAELVFEWWVEGLVGQVHPDQGARAQGRSRNGRVVVVAGTGSD